MFIELLFSLYANIMQNEKSRELYDLIQKLNSENINVIEYVNDPRFKIFDAGKKRKEEKKIDLTNPKQHRYMTEKSINDSLKFMEDYKEWLDRAEESDGIEREYITALLNIESHFGDNCGSTPVINGLFSHYLFTERKDLFYNYIKEFEKVVKEKGIKDVFEWAGSDAGASTPAQLMPDNVRKYGTDFNGDGYHFDDVVDAIGSCAKFLRTHGFRADKRKAIRAYNPWSSFVDAVELHAETLKTKKSESNTPYP